jgi:MFS family permease
MFVRQFGWSIGEVGKIYGTLILLVGPAGILGGGWLIDWTYRKGRHDAPVFIAMIGAAMAVPAILLMPMMPNGFWTMVMIAPSTFGLSMTTAAGAVAVVVVTPNQIRGQTIAIYTLIISLFGLILGPTGVAVITDYVFKDENMVHWSLGLVGVVSAICSAILLASILKPFRTERKLLLDQTTGLP